ncbi:hypothetical protein H318_14778 [Enterococcus durans IPLA 655]|uniref:hypothetical protein n=1 Tax=Enterococcus durans TaxID=53345 RepID=UPI00032878F2|nr:hypothetical protein [Enterococcus durans]EMS74340.1 hypothetical protein H318_14778 [Enterococcus durans IPLA 655]
MDFDDCIYRLYEISKSENEEINQRFHSLAFNVSKNGITGLVPLEDGGISDGVPFTVILSTLQSGLEQATTPLDRTKIEALYSDLLSEGVDGYRQ